MVSATKNNDEHYTSGDRKKAVPKAALYSFPESIWCSAVFLTLEEKGFGSDEIEVKTVDLLKGENFSPSFLRINPSATVPSLVVPLDKSLAPDTEVRFKAINDTKAIVEFLDKSRSATSKTHTTSNAPAPALSPTSLEFASLSGQIIALLHSPLADPNYFPLTATSPEELHSDTKAPRKTFLENRQKVLDGLLSSQRSESSAPTDLEYPSAKLSPKTIGLLESAATLNRSTLAVYSSTNPNEQNVVEFFAKSKEAWVKSLRLVLDALEQGGAEITNKDGIIGKPYVLGDQLSLADMHLAAWLARIIFSASGEREVHKDSINVLEAKIGGAYKVGAKLREFWEAIIERDSFKKVYSKGLH